MRVRLSAILLVLYGWAGAQPTGRTSAIQAAEPEYFIDSQKVDFPMLWADPQNIASISIPEKNNQHPNGAIYMTWKKPHPVFLTLKEISDRQTGLDKDRILYIIDDSLLRDTSRVRIEAANIFRVHILPSTEIGYIPQSAGAFSLLLVETMTSFKKKLPPDGVIYHIH